MLYPGFDLTGLSALVTGGTSGLGQAIALGLAQAGARVTVGSRDPAKLAATVAELGRHGEGHGGIPFSAFYGWADVAAYSTSKAAVVNLTQSLANDWAKHRIRINAIAPGVFPTPLNRPLIEGTPRGDWFLAHTPMDRYGEPEELVGAAIYLASPAASYCTGEVLTVDGGFRSRGVGV